VGSNNYELNRRAFMRLLHAPFDPTVLEVLRAEALEACILGDDIDRTFISVTTDVASQWQLPSEWWLAVVDDGYLRNKRSAARLMAAATVIARLAVMHDRLTVGLSGRQLAEELNCSANTAHGLLRLLTVRGWLEPEDGAYDQALRYTLVFPEFHKGDSPPLFAYEGRLCQEWKHWDRLSAVSTHDAFARKAGEPSLTLSDAKVLVACESDSKSFTELKVATRLAQSTLYKTLNQLERAGLLVREEGTDKFALVRTPLEDALDSWFAGQNVPSRRDRRKAQHQVDRLSWSEEPRRPRKAVRDPLVATPRASRSREPQRAARDTHEELVELRRRLDAKKELKTHEGESRNGQTTTG
jgi:DNA-binding MarR family transcriptional regulator